MLVTEFSFSFMFIGIVLSLILLLSIAYRILYYKPLYYAYPLTHYLKALANRTYDKPRTILFFLRLVLLSILILLCMGPQKAQQKSFVKAHGIDIMMVLDVSGSMKAVEDVNNPVERIQTAKTEVNNFIKQRPHDHIGLVIFAKNALCRCPLTSDKVMLSNLVDDISLGLIDPSGTALAHGMLLSAQKLAHSTAKSRVMIVVTDGNPSPHDIALQPVIELINQLYIKVYMIGIGNPLDRAYFNYPGIGFVAQSIPLNLELLNSIAQATAGRAFLAQSAEQLAQAYAMIDVLEKTEKNVPVFTLYKSYFRPLVYGALITLFFEWFLNTFFWVCL